MKKWIKIGLVVFSVVLGLISSLERVSAQSIETISTGSKARVKTKNRELNVYLDIIMLNGEHVYCIEPDVYFTEGIGYEKDTINPNDLSVNQVNYFSSLDYLWKTKYNYSHDVFAVIAMMIYESVEPGIEFDFYEGNITNESYHIYKERLIQDVEEFQKTPSFSNEIFEVEKGETINVIDHNNSLSNYELIGDNSYYSFKSAGDKLELTGISETETDSYIRGTKVSDEYIGISYIYRKPDSQTLVSIKMFEEHDFSLKIKVTNSKGQFELVKINTETNETVSGVTFKISKTPDMSELLGIYTTDSNGKISLDDLVEGNYYIQEIDAPTNLVIDSRIHEIEIRAKQLTKVTLENRETITKISKIDKYSRNYIPGAHFELYDDIGKLVYSWESTNESFVIKGLDRGKTYKLIEKTAPFGYKKKDPIQFAVSDTEETIVEYENEKLDIVDTGFDRCTYIPVPMLSYFLLLIIKKRFI